MIEKMRARIEMSQWSRPILKKITNEFHRIAKLDVASPMARGTT